MKKVETKRGYVKWTDENGKRHKVPEAEYNAVEELLEEPDTRADEPSDDDMQESVRY